MMPVFLQASFFVFCYSISMKRILFIAPDSVGIIKVIKEQLSGNDEYIIDYIDLVLQQSEKFRYKSFAHRAQNFYLKKIRSKNLKHTHYNKCIREKITRSNETYDVIVIIRPDLVNNENLQLLRNRTKYYVAYYWDSVSFFPRKLAISHFFDRVFSFDIKDCRAHGFELLTNFYFFEEVPEEIKYKVYGLVSYDKRKTHLEMVAAEFRKAGISFCIKAYRQKEFQSDYLTCITDVLDYKEMLKEISCSDVLLEVQKEGQQGLTFRPFEALGLKKKLITNNPLIKEYDFYSDHNICVIDPENINIPPGFFSTPYREIDPQIREKYHFRNWFKKLVSPITDSTTKIN
jgi:hypothetical protein